MMRSLAAAFPTGTIARRPLPVALSGLWLLASLTPAQSPPPDFHDQRHQLEQLGIRQLRPGADPRQTNPEPDAVANALLPSLPPLLAQRDGTRIRHPEQWLARRAEILADFEREVYGRIPTNVPPVHWSVTAESNAVWNGIPVVTRTLAGAVSHPEDTNRNVTLRATLTVPSGATSPVPVMVEITYDPARWGGGRTPAWHPLAISNGWGCAALVATSVQPDTARLDTGIIGLVNRGQPRQPEDWGALRAWQWGVSRLVDCLVTNRALQVDPEKIGVAGLSRFGKVALVSLAYEPRLAVGFIGSSGQGGTKLHRRQFGERLENLAGGAPHWMAGRYLHYAAADPAHTVAELPVDAHQLIAACAPRPCFISHGLVEKGDAHWVDVRGSFMAAVAAGPAYRLLGRDDLGVGDDYLNTPLPPVNQLVGGALAWRQHDGGHELTPNWPAFFAWVRQFISAPAPDRVSPVSAPSQAP